MPQNQSQGRTPRRQQVLKGIAIALAVFASQGMNCSEHLPPPSLATIHIKDIHLQILDPASGTPGVYLAWSAPADGKVSFYEIYQGSRKDSLGHSPFALRVLPDSSRPMTVYFAVRAVWVEPTGQKLISDTLAIDSLTILPSFSILSPSSGSLRTGRLLRIELVTNSDMGIVLNAVLYEKNGSVWTTKQKFCLPRNSCDNPIFGSSLQTDSLTLEDVAPGDTVQSLFCVQGTESFQGHLTGLDQSLGCSRYNRVAQ
jgi:hypothetical protein